MGSGGVSGRTGGYLGDRLRSGQQPQKRGPPLSLRQVHKPGVEVPGPVRERRDGRDAAVGHGEGAGGSEGLLAEIRAGLRPEVAVRVRDIGYAPAGEVRPGEIGERVAIR